MTLAGEGAMVAAALFYAASGCLIKIFSRYEDPVVMAAGAFNQGSSIELSADGPIREPFNVYFQGGITFEHSKMGVYGSIDKMLKKGLITL